MNLNTLDLMIAALYLRYRKRDDHFLSALWARSVIGLIIALCGLTIFQLITYFYEFNKIYEFVKKSYFFLFMGFWGLCTFFVFKVSINNKNLLEIDLLPEDYSRGNWLAFLLLGISGGLFVFIILYTKG